MKAADLHVMALIPVMVTVIPVVAARLAETVVLAGVVPLAMLPRLVMEKTPVPAAIPARVEKLATMVKPATVCADQLEVVLLICIPR